MNEEINKVIEEYRKFCRDNVYVCAYCDHCLEEDAIVDFFSQALTTIYTKGQEQERKECEKEKARILAGFSHAMALISEGKFEEGNKKAEETMFYANNLQG